MPSAPPDKKTITDLLTIMAALRAPETGLSDSQIQRILKASDLGEYAKNTDTNRRT